MATPEGRVKDAVKRILAKHKGDLDPYWPVPAGYGESHLDNICCAYGRFLTIETKAPGKKPTPRQKDRIRKVRRAGGIALVIDGTDKRNPGDEFAVTSLPELEALLEQIRHDARAGEREA